MLPLHSVLTVQTTGILIGQHHHMEGTDQSEAVYLVLSPLRIPGPVKQLFCVWKQGSSGWIKPGGAGDEGNKAMEEARGAADVHSQIRSRSWWNPSWREISRVNSGTKSLKQAWIHTGAVQETICNSYWYCTAFLFKSHAVPCSVICAHSFCFKLHCKESVLCIGEYLTESIYTCTCR